MENLKEKVQEFFVESYTTNLDSFSHSELKYITDYMTNLSQNKGVFKISRIINTDEKLEIEVKTGTVRFKK